MAQVDFWSIDWVAASIWVHTVIIYSLVPSLVGVRAGRVKLPGSDQFASDWKGFFFFILGAILFVIVLGPFILDPLITYYFDVAKSLPIFATNLFLLFLEYGAFKVVILGRSF